eukprot:4556878-Pleurochrysis_carterae.AAC.3
MRLEERNGEPCEAAKTSSGSGDRLGNMRGARARVGQGMFGQGVGLRTANDGVKWRWHEV